MQADSIIPSGVQGLDRYAYVNNSPINYVDPSGHINGRPCELRGECEKITYDDDSDRLPISTSGQAGGNRNSFHHEGKVKTESWQTTLNAKIGIHAGPLGDIFVPEYNSDDYNGVAFVYNYNTDENFWLMFDIHYNESTGTVISDIMIVNYSDYRMFLNAMWFESNGETNYIQWRGFGKTLPSGFGSDFVVPGPDTVFQGNHDITLGFELGYSVNLGQGPFNIYPDFTFTIPALQDVRYFFETGSLPSLNPLNP